MSWPGPTDRNRGTPLGVPAVGRSLSFVLGCMLALPSTGRAAGDPGLISVDFIQAGGTTCSGDTTLTGTTMKNAVGNLFTGQEGSWNPLNIGTYNQTSATSSLLKDGAGNTTTARLVLGRATGLDQAAAGGWRCSPNEGAVGGSDQLRSETAYLYNGVITGDHFAWAFTGLTPNALYRLTCFGGSGNTTGASNVANGVSGVRDSEGDWNWDSLTADGNGTILGTFIAPHPTLGLFGAQIKYIPRTQPPSAAPGTPSPADGSVNVPTRPTLGWSAGEGAESYDVYLWPTAQAKPATPTATVTVPQHAPSGVLPPLTGYSWQVGARNSAGVTSGPVWAFTTNDGRPPEATAPSPADGATGVLVDGVFDWGDSVGADSYQIYIWPAGGSKPGTPTATVTSSTYAPASPLAGNTLYNWQVGAVNSHGVTLGAVWSFNTGDRYPGYLVPWPKNVAMGSGDFTVTAATRIVAEDAGLLPLAQVMARDILMAAGLHVTTLQGTAQTGDIALRIDPGFTGEAYELRVNGSNIILSGGNYQAVAWASVTLLQALDTSGTPAKVPQMIIEDGPAAPLRAVMWDIARFFHPLETLYEFVDLHRMYKVTYMHLFMSADGLFTFGSTLYPALMKTNNGGVAYGGSPGFYLPPTGSRLYYTKAELTALVNYARDRGVVIVPEIDTPSWAAFMTDTLPGTFSSAGGTVRTHDVNINYATAVTAVENLIGELAAVFHTSPCIHIGADEVPASQFESYPYWASSSAANNYATGAEGLVWYMNRLNSKIASLGKTTWSWSAPGAIGKGYDLPASLVYTAWGHDDGQYASQGGFQVMRAAGGHVAGMGQANRNPPYNRCLLYRPAQGIYNRLTPLFRFIGAPDNIYTHLEPTFLPLTGRENQIVGAHIMSWETPHDVEVPAMRLSMPALGEPTWNQETSPRRNWENFLIRQARTDNLYRRVMRPVEIRVSTQVDPQDSCFAGSGMVVMESPVAGTIRYTVGTDYKNSWFNFPTSSSPAYTGPFPINQSSVISARLFDAAGNPLGNPVTRGFYQITPRTHFRYFFTGSTPAPDFDKGTPVARSVMGRMDGGSPHEEVRFGDNDHRAIYSGAINVAAGSYTFAAAFAGGAIAIDRVPVTNGVPVNLTAGEHLVRIVTPASGLGTPYTFSGPGHGAGSDINLLLKPLADCSEVFPASHSFGQHDVAAGATDKREITIVNRDVFEDMVITSVQLAGAHAGEFVITEDSGETVLAPGAERIVAVCFDPVTGGAKSATLQVVASGLAGGSANVALAGTALASQPPPAPDTPSPADASTNTQLDPLFDWADSASAVDYDIFLWLAGESKPAVPTATVSVSQWRPPFMLAPATDYHWQVTANNTNGSTPGPVWSFTTEAASGNPAGLVSIDMVTATSAAVSGDVPGSPFTGQVGPWNRLVMTGGQVTLANLRNGVGSTTGVGFVLGSGYSSQIGSNPPVTGVVLSAHNPERAWITGSDKLNFRFTGLTPGARYTLAVYTTGSAKMILTINGVPHTNVGTIFVTSQVAAGNGEILGVASLNGSAHSDYTEISGLQIEAVPEVPAYDAWAAAAITARMPGGDVSPTGDPDGDGADNLTEFAFHGDPLDGSARGFHLVALEDTDVDNQPELTLTLAVRNGSGSPVFSGPPTPTANVDGITYGIEGSLDLLFPGSLVSETAVPGGLPPLPEGWEYRRFRLDASNGLPDRGFLRAKASQP